LRKKLENSGGSWARVRRRGSYFGTPIGLTPDIVRKITLTPSKKNQRKGRYERSRQHESRNAAAAAMLLNEKKKI